MFDIRKIGITIILLTASIVQAGTFSAEYGVTGYQTTVPDQFGTPVGYRISIPELHGEPLQRIKAIVFSLPGVGASGLLDADDRWHKWLYENQLAYMRAGDEYQDVDGNPNDESRYLIAARNFSSMVLGTNIYPELDNAPLMPYGESGGGSDAFSISYDNPQRVIAFMAEHTQYWISPIPEAMKTVPAYFRWGEFDFERWDNGYYDIIGDSIKEKLQAGAQWMCTPENRQTHATTRYAVEETMGFFSLMLPLRYTYQEGVTNHDPRLGPVVLNTIARTNGWLGEHRFGTVQTVPHVEKANRLKDWECRDPYTAPYETAERTDKYEHSWMADQKTAAFWATKFSYGEHDLINTYLDTIEDDFGSNTIKNRGAYFPNLFTIDQQVRLKVDPSGFTNTTHMEFWMDDQLIATDNHPPYQHAYTFTTNNIGVHFIYPIAIASTGERCLGRRRVLQIYSNVRDGNHAPRISNIDPFTSTPSSTVQIPFTVEDDETAAASLSVSWHEVNRTGTFGNNSYSTSITGSGSNRVLNITMPSTNGIIWGLVQVSDGDISVNEYVQINISRNDGRGEPFFVAGETATAVGDVFEAGAVSKRISVHVYDYDTPLDDVVLTARSSNTSMLPDSNIRVGGTGRFRYVQVKPLSAGYCTVNLTLSDGRTSATAKFGIPTNSSTNHNPIISDIPDQSAAQGRTSDPISVRVYDLRTSSEPLVPGDVPLSLVVTSANPSLIANHDIEVADAGDRRFITFTPSATATGSATLTAIVTDGNGASATDTFAVAVSAASSLSAVSETLTSAYLSQAYSTSLSATGGVEPISWSLLSGSLPPGQSLSTGGDLSGVPETTGTYAFTAQVIDSNPSGVSTSSAAFSLTILPDLAPPQNLTLLAHTDFSVDISWDDNSTGETGYEIQRRDRTVLAWNSLVTVAANSTNYNDSTVTSGHEYDYRIRPVAGATAGTFSDLQNVEVLITPYIFTQPIGHIVLNGNDTVLNVAAAGGQLAYQWYEGLSGDVSTPVSGATDMVFTTAQLNATQSYWVQITNAIGYINSSTATLTVEAAVWPVYVDFGPTLTTTDSEGNHWNNITSHNGSFGPLIDSVGNETAIMYQTVESAFDAISHSTPVTGTPYPDTAASDELRVTRLNPCSIRLSGLLPTVNYDFTLFSTSGTINESLFSVGSETQAMFNSSGNLSNLLVFANIPADESGEILIGVTVELNRIGTLNVMEISKSPDPIVIEISTDSLSVPEGSTNTFNIRLSDQPGNTCTVTVSRVSGDSDVSVLSGSPAIFTTNNWDQWQTIVLEAAEDGDTADSSAVFQCSEPSLTPVRLTATEADNDFAVTVQSDSLLVAEGGTIDLLAQLNIAPASDYTVTVSRVSGDTDISVSSGAQLVFTASDYMSWHTSVVAAAQDADQTEGSAVIRLTSDAAENVDVTVTEQDDDFTIVASGLLAAWNLDTISSSPTVTQTNAYLMATGLVQSVLTHSDTAEMRGGANALKAIDNDGSTYSEAISGGNYFYWNLQPESNHVVTVTSVVFRTKGDGTVGAFLLSDASGLTSIDVLGTNGAAAAAVTVDLSGNSSFEQVSSNIEFRIYGYLGADGYKALYVGNAYVVDGLDDVQVYGTVAYSSPGDPDDADADGLPDSWEAQYFGSNSADPNAMASNGVNTVREAYIAGLNPTNSTSRLTVDALQPLRWSAVSGRVYSVYWTTNLLKGFQTLETNLTSGVFTDAVHNLHNEGFYRIDVRLAE